MLTEYRSVYKGGEGEIVEKKSRFIAAVSPAASEEEALAFIEVVRKKHWNARHNCYAYIIGAENPLARCSDDGEPGGTAGRPMLEVLEGEELRNVVVVVTRYFGGVLLGTGGLVRAYSQAVKEGLASSLIITKIHGLKLKIETDYTGLGKIQYALGQKGLKTLNCTYTEKVEIEALIPDSLLEEMEKEITEVTNGKALLHREESCYFAEVNGDFLVLD